MLGSQIAQKRSRPSGPQLCAKGIPARLWQSSRKELGLIGKLNCLKWTEESISTASKNPIQYPIIHSSCQQRRSWGALKSRLGDMRISRWGRLSGASFSQIHTS